MAYNTKIQLGLYEYKNSHFIKQAIIDDYYEISFTRNLYEAGDFTITINKNIPNASLFKRGLFVRFGNDDYDMGEIVSISTSVGAEGKASETLLINGKDLRYLFHRRIIIKDNANGKWEMTGKGEMVLRSLAKDQCGIGTESKRRLPIENNIPTVDNAIGGECSISEAFTNLYEVMATIATQTNTGWRVKYHDGNLTLECFSGVDRSKNVFFTVSHDALQEGNFVDSSESFANTVYVGGKGQGDERDIYEGENGNPENMDRFEAWDDQSSMTNENEYEAEAGAMLTQYGQTINVSGNTLAKSPYIYKEQYDVGDIVTIGFSDQKAVTQILSVTENWSGIGNYSTSFSFGKPLPTLNNQLQLILKQIRKASDNSSSTDSVRWYTIPTDTEMPKADVTFNTIGFIGNAGAGATFKLHFDENGTGSKSYHVWFKQLAGGKLTLTTGVAGKQNLEMDSGTYVAIIYVDQEGNVLNQASAVSVNSAGGQSAGTANTITVNGQTYDVGGGGGSGSGSGIPLGGWTSFENDTAPNTEWLQAGTTFDSNTYPELFLYLGGNTVPERYDHSRLGSCQDITIPKNSNNAITMPYDGILYINALTVSGDNLTTYINNNPVSVSASICNTSAYRGYDSITLHVSKGDSIYYTGSQQTTVVNSAQVAYYTHPMFIKATTTASSYTPASAVQEIKDYTKDYVDAKCPDYSITEHLTGRKWIDGKPIYKITKEGTGNFSNNYWTNITLFNDNIQKKVVKMDMICNTCCLRIQSFEITNTLAFSTATSSGNGSTGNNAKYILTIEYTKTTD